MTTQGHSANEMFILSMIECGVDTVFGLQTTAGLSPGTSVPLLRRLAEGGLVRRPSARVQRKLRFTVTPRGEQHLNQNWRRAVNDTAPDLSEIVRMFWVAQQQGEQHAVYALDAAASRRRHKAQGMLHNAEGLQRDFTLGPAHAYEWMKTYFEGLLLTAEAAVLEQLFRAMVDGVDQTDDHDAQGRGD